MRQRIQTRQTPAPTRYEYDNATTYAHATTHDNRTEADKRHHTTHACCPDKFDHFERLIFVL